MECARPAHCPPPTGESDNDGFPENINGPRWAPGFLSRCAAHHSSSPHSPPPPRLRARRRCYFLFLIMFLKTALTFLAVGALSVSALTVPVARSPAPEPECEFLRSFSYLDLTLASFNSPRARGQDFPYYSRLPSSSGQPNRLSGQIQVE